MISGAAAASAIPHIIGPIKLNGSANSESESFISNLIKMFE